MAREPARRVLRQVIEVTATGDKIAEAFAAAAPAIFAPLELPMFEIPQIPDQQQLAHQQQPAFRIPSVQHNGARK